MRNVAMRSPRELLVESVFSYPDVQLGARQPERLGCFRLVEAGGAQRFLDHRALDCLQLARDDAGTGPSKELYEAEGYAASSGSTVSGAICR